MFSSIKQGTEPSGQEESRKERPRCRGCEALVSIMVADFRWAVTEGCCAMCSDHELTLAMVRIPSSFFRRPQHSTALFFNYNQSLGPPYRILIDTNFINFSIQNKLEIVQAAMDCLFAKCMLWKLRTLRQRDNTHTDISCSFFVRRFRHTYDNRLRAGRAGKTGIKIQSRIAVCQPHAGRSWLCC